VLTERRKKIMKNIFIGFLVSGFTWFTFIGAITLLKMVNQTTGYKATFIFLVALISMIFSIAQMSAIGRDISIADKARKSSETMEAKKNDLPKM
jgi:protein-S-isoprenylcysteine O-methyltransferase Ste14